MRGRNERFPRPQFPQLDEVLSDLGDALLAFMDREIRPILELLVDLLERGRIVGGQLDFLPEMLGRVGALDRFHVQV